MKTINNDVLAGLQSRDNAIEICGPRTGHAVKPIAFCQGSATAEMLVARIKAVNDLIEAITLLIDGAEQLQAKGIVQPQINGGMILAKAAIDKTLAPVS